MTRLRRQDQLSLLDQLSHLGYGQAEAEERDSFVKRFHPVPEHARAFDLDVVLVVGERGAGKSELFRAAFELHLLDAIGRQAPRVRLPSGATSWIPAYPLGKGFPDPRGLREFLAGGGQHREEELWFAYLVRVLAEQLDPQDKEDLSPLLTPPGGAPREIHGGFESVGNAPLLALDRLDEKLKKESRWIFVGYDELDTLGGSDLNTMAGAIRGLIGFWANYSRRWERLRSKIFIRSDLFRRHSGLGGADFAKLAANRAELTWSDRNLFAMLLKRIGNTSEELLGYIKGAKIHFKAADPDLGAIPELERAEDARPLVERMVGRYMGANVNKGQSFSWLLDHVRDGKGRATPRAFVRLIEQAAQKERDKPRLKPPQLLHPTSLRQALADVSLDHVRQAVNNEWPWLQGVKERVKGSLVPWVQRSELERLLGQDWEESWGATEEVRPPAADARELIDYLLELGVFRERSRGRVDTPDLFLYGLELKRRGGVAKK